MKSPTLNEIIDKTPKQALSKKHKRFLGKIAIENNFILVAITGFI